LIYCSELEWPLNVITTSTANVSGAIVSSEEEYISEEVDYNNQ